MVGVPGETGMRHISNSRRRLQRRTSVHLGKNSEGYERNLYGFSQSLRVNGGMVARNWPRKHTFRLSPHEN
jgi:hypothetical protein